MDEEIIVNGPLDSFDMFMIGWQIINVLFFIAIIYFGVKIYRKLNKYLNMRIRQMEEDESDI